MKKSFFRRFASPLSLASLALLLTLEGAWAASPANRPAGKPAVDPALFSTLKWREVGPYRGGRSAAVAGLPGDRNTYYFGGTGGGVWKTTDSGRTWRNVSDGFYGGSIGAVAVSEWDPNVVYVGGGEKTVRGNVSHGDGLWKSTDAGKTWKHVGLADSRHIPRVRIHPKNPDLVYAAVLGHLFGPNDMRGVYRSKNGGASWERVLFVSDRAGAVDLAMDPANPRILYATTWNVRRTPHSLESGGPGSGIWKSTDGGDTWIELTRNPGLPKGTVGISGITVSPTNPENVYAIVEAEDGGVFRSRDGGKTWTRTNEDRNLRQRAWYYTRIYADPKDEEAVYVLNVQFHRSKDGGKSFTSIRVPHGDNHDLWIDPNDPLRMIESNDGGANVSTDGGATWSPQTNQPTAQFYRVSTDTSFPYRILGAQQDNTAVRIRSRGAGPGIGPDDWEETAGGESGYIVADPTQPDVVYGGSYGGLLTRLNHDTGELRDVNPWPNDPMGAGAGELTYRFQWNFPIFFSPHTSPNNPKTLYSAANVLFKSTDGGQSWQPVSPDLTRNDKSRQGPSGGPITKDNTSVEYYGTIFAAAESALEPGVLWAGSDDGLIHISRDGGSNWKNVTPKGLPEWILINAIDASPHEKGGAYVAATLYKADDFRPYLYKTADYGATWTRIDSGIDPLHFTRVVRADPGKRGLLYAGTERGVYVSFDDGARWQPFQLNLPIVPITDLTVKDGDLVAATQGRGFWVLDGLGPVREATANREADARGQRKAWLLPPAPAYRQPNQGWSPPRPPQGMGENPPAGVVIQYYLQQAPAADQAKQVKLEILTQDGKVVRTFQGKPAEGPKKPAEPKAMGEAHKEEEAARPTAESAQSAKDKGGEAEKEQEDEEEDKDEPKVPTEAGLNRFVWDMTWSPASKFPGMILWSGDPIAPFAVPGSYQIRLTANGETLTQPFEIRKDPRSSSTQADLEAQFRFLQEARDKLTETHDAIRRIREVRAQLDDTRKRLRRDEAMKPVVDAARDLNKKMTEVEEVLYQTKNRSSQDPLNFPIRLNDKLNAVAGSASLGDYRPTAQAVQVKNELAAAIDAQLAKLKGIWDADLARFNELAREKGVPAVIVPPARLK